MLNAANPSYNMLNVLAALVLWINKCKTLVKSQCQVAENITIGTYLSQMDWCIRKNLSTNGTEPLKKPQEHISELLMLGW
jgi:hypothetical protein